MRVVSGFLKGRKLLSFEGSDIRPTSDFAKEAVFTKISANLANMTFLDLFAGSGAIGIEAISRGANFTVFCDKNSKSYNLIKNNLLGLDIDTKLFSLNLVDFDKFLKENTFVFDYIYIDPPYKMAPLNEILDVLNKKNIFSNKGYIIYEHEGDFSLNREDYYIESSKKYGRIRIEYIKRR